MRKRRTIAHVNLRVTVFGLCWIFMSSAVASSKTDSTAPPWHDISSACGPRSAAANQHAERCEEMRLLVHQGQSGRGERQQ